MHKLIENTQTHSKMMKSCEPK